MKIKSLISLCLAGFAATGFAQTHVDGEEYFKAGQYNNAYNLLERSLSNPQTDKAVSNYYLGSYWILGKDNAKAENYFKAGVAANAESPLNYVGLGKLRLMAGDLKGAEAQFKLAEKFGKKNPAVTIAIARAYYDVDPVLYEKQIFKLIEKAQKQDMTNPDIYIFMGDMERDAKNIGGAAGKYDMAKGYDPKSAVAYVKNAELYHKVNPQLAISSLQELLKNNPTSALGQHELAETYEEQQDYKNAAIQYGKYVENPAHFKSDESKYSFLLYYDKQFKKGYDYATQLLVADPGNYDAQRYQLLNASNLPEMSDQVLGMAEALYATHKTDPKKKPLAFVDYFTIQNLLNNNHRFDESAEILQEGIENPNLEKFRNQLMDAKFQTYMRGAKTMMSEGVQESKNGNQDKAKELYNQGMVFATKASGVMPESFEPQFITGTLASLVGDIPLAAKLYEEAAALLDASGTKGVETQAKTIYKVLGDYFSGNKDNEKAKVYYGKFLELEPDNADVAAKAAAL
ncbi:MAG: tetratricopeptide repeat protein [Bacteroides sp.]|nr:tetratricopeptide repeat protein [Bacteroides sp.]